MTTHLKILRKIRNEEKDTAHQEIAAIFAAKKPKNKARLPERGKPNYKHTLIGQSYMVCDWSGNVVLRSHKCVSCQQQVRQEQ